MKKDEADYRQSKSRFFDMELKDDEIVIRPLKSVSEFMEEARLLHHCVFSNRYFAKNGSLILHALIEGVPVETIEVDLSSLEVVQSRAKYNGTSTYHERIVRLMQDNMDEVYKRITA